MSEKKKLVISMILLGLFTAFAIVNLVFGFLEIAGVFALDKTVSVCFDLFTFVGFGVVCFFAGKHYKIFQIEITTKKAKKEE